MNKNLLLAMMAALLVVIGGFIFLTRAPAPLPTSNAEPPAANVPALTAPPTVAQAPVKSQPVATTDSSVLATVNGVPISEKDLEPVEAGEPPNALAKRAMLDRAIDRELIRQAAEAQGIALTSEQRAHLALLPEGVVNSSALDLGKPPEPDLRMQAQVDYQLREATAQFLLSTLAQAPIEAAPEAIPSQEQRMRNYLNGLRAAAKIEVNR